MLLKPKKIVKGGVSPVNSIGEESLLFLRFSREKTAVALTQNPIEEVMKKKLWILSFIMAMVFMMAGANSAFASVLILNADKENGVGNWTGEDGLQTVLDKITVSPSPIVGDSRLDVNAHQLSFDKWWSISGSGGSVSTIVIELAGWSGTNTFGIYDRADILNKVEIFDGADSNNSGPAGTPAQVRVSMTSTGDVIVDSIDIGIDFNRNMFGFYLDASGNYDPNDPLVDMGGIWYSDTSKNADGTDHMAAYQGLGIDTIQVGNFAAGLWTTNEYILAWEDKSAAYMDGDYQDFVVIVESVTPAVVPIPSALLLLSSGLMGFVGFRRKFRS